MDYLSEASTWQRITKKLILYCIPLLLIYALFIFISNEMVFHNHHFPSVQVFFKSRSFRFFFRELEVYTFGYLGFRFLKKHLSENWSKLFLLILIICDVLVSSVGFYRYSVADSHYLDIIYNQILVFIASPFYFMIFSIFALYLKPSNLIENRNEE